MEPNVSPTFTDPVILKFLDESWLASSTSGKINSEILVGHSSIHIGFDAKLTPQLHISFLTEKYNFIGSFSYHLERNPVSMELTPIFVQTLFLETFGKQKSYLSKTASIEKLMNYPDFKEWLLWNRP
jgi:hypothetical protein